MKVIVCSLMVMSLAGAVACNKKSSGKKGAAAPEETPLPAPDLIEPSVSPIPTALTGYRCPSISGGDAQSAVIDTTQNRMQITTTAGIIDYTLVPNKKWFFPPSYAQYTATITGAQTGGSGDIAIDQDNKFLGRENPNTYKVLFRSVPIGMINGKEKSIGVGTADCER
jgi:hypothetical protein